MRRFERPLKSLRLLAARALGLALALSVVTTVACGSDAETTLTQRLDPVGAPDLAGGEADVSTGPDVVVADSDTPRELEDNALCQDDSQCLSRHCWWRRDGRRCAPSCADAACPEGLFCGDEGPGGGRHCVDRWVAQCTPCDDDSACHVGAAAGHPTGFPAARCQAQGPAAGGVCVIACEESAEGKPCPDGASCVGGFCTPEDAAVCTCSAFAVATGARAACSRPGEAGFCLGSRSCETVGVEASACDATTPAAETCNGRDDDCDGQTDEAPATAACRPYGCGGDGGCLASCDATGTCAPGFGCDPASGLCAPDGSTGSVCESQSDCNSESCSNGHCCPAGVAGDADALCCAEDADCGALDLEAVCLGADAAGCRGTRGVGRCVDAVCQTVTIADASGCEGQICKDPECAEGGGLNGAGTCQPNGACGGAQASLCLDGNPCTTDLCAEGACSFPPRAGTTETACYSHSAATRGRGACRDGRLTCAAGEIGPCVGDVGPAIEVCNGLDDDCDGLTDFGVEAECFPYLCVGLSGCGSACQVAADCAAGTFCGAGGQCVPTGEDGAMCQTDLQCASGHCGGGVCCESGLCCNDDLDCGSLSVDSCEDQSVDGCLGFKATGRCGAGFRCTADVVPAPASCLGVACGNGPACLVSGKLGSAWACNALGGCAAGSVQDCSPYRCRGAACPVSCQGDEQCMVGSLCRSGVCLPLVDGSSCTADQQCASAHCSQGVCCRGELCCKTDANCTALNGQASCSDVSSCTGRVPRGECRADFICETRVVAAPAACQGLSCARASCTNLSGGNTVREGVNRPVCSATGTCADAVRDCRQYESGAYCDQTDRVIYNNCSNCSEDRNTCVKAGFGCSCE